MAVAMIVTMGRTRANTRARKPVAPTAISKAKAVLPSGRGEGVESDAPDEGPDEPAVESSGDGPDDRQDKDEMRLGIAHP